MKATKFKIILITAVTLLIPGLKYTDAFADTPSIALSPMYQKIVLIPGEEYRSSFSIVNPESSTENLHYKAGIGSYSPMMDGERGIYGGADTTTITGFNKITEWIKIENPEGIVAPNSRETLSFSIEVPKDAPAGGQYATIIVGSVDNGGGDTGENGATIKSYINIGYIIYAEVAGTTIQEGAITENSFPSILANSELKATSMVRNDGNIHTDAEYTLQVWPLFSDEEICTNEEEPDTSLIMPETERYHVQTCNLPAVGIFKAKQTVKIFGEESTLEKMIIVCPLWLIFIIIFIIVALIVWIVVRIRTHKKSAANE